MKIPIKINDKKYTIKPILELTTSEFIELAKIKDLDVVKYIAWQTGVGMNDAFFAVTSKAVELAVGKVPDITKFSKSNRFDYKKIIETVGQRHQIEACNLQGYELLVFILAVSQAKSNNIDDVNLLIDKYMQEPFTEILPSGFFFYKKLQTGSNCGRNYLKRLTELIKTARRKKGQVKKS